MSSNYRGRGGDRGRGDRGRGGPSGRGGRGGGGRGGLVVQMYSPPTGIPATDQNVTRIEDAIQASRASAGGVGELSLQPTFPSRPGYGIKGTPLTIWANYVVMTAPPKLVLHRYDVAVTPALAGTKISGPKLTQIIRLLLETPELAPYKDDVVTDFGSTLISRKKFGDQTITVHYRADIHEEPREGAKEYTVQLQLTNVLTVSQLTDYLASTNLTARYDDKAAMIQAFNIFLNHYAKSTDSLATIGSNKTFALTRDASTSDLGSGLNAVRGFFASVRAATGRVLVNVNVSQGVFYQEGPLNQLITRFGARKNLFKLQSFLKRLRIRTTHLHLKKNKQGEVIHRVKTIIALATPNDGQGSADSNPPKVKSFGAGPKDVEFWLSATPTSSSKAPVQQKKPGKGGKQTSSGAATGGRYISVYNFFQETYGIRLSEPDMPVVNVGNRENPVYLPSEVCFVLPGQPIHHRLDPGQTQQMIRFAVRPPWENASSIVKQGLDTVGLSPSMNPRLGQFGITTVPQLVTISARVLVGPKVVYRQNKPAQMTSGGWNMVPRDSPGLKFNIGGTMQKWSCLYIDMPDAYPNACKFTLEALNQLVTNFTATLQDTGIVANPPLAPQRVLLNNEDDSRLEEFIQRAANSLQLLLVIVPATPIPLYNRIKQLGDLKYGIHTICCVGTKIAKTQGQDQYYRNVATKFNLKLGGSNHLVEAPRLGLVSEDKTMVVGIDVTHPSPGSSSNAPSVAGMVASVDRSLGQWPGVLSVQTVARQEMVAHLKDMLKSRLRLWIEKGKHTQLPENILIYRDGVSEGQYQIVMDQEVPLLRAACQEVYSPDSQKKGLPRLTVVIVGKRHRTRFYPTREGDADRSGNTKPGTVVDRGVTEARNWDFFLQAHAALQGTARPAHYFIVLDEIFRSRYAANKSPAKPNVADELQDLTQSMCYLFGRATKAVSIATPAYYADILCERARCYLSRVYDSPNNSAAPSVASGTALARDASQEDVQIHGRLKDTMFYI